MTSNRGSQDSWLSADNGTCKAECSGHAAATSVAPRQDASQSSSSTGNAVQSEAERPHARKEGAEAPGTEAAQPTLQDAGAAANMSQERVGTLSAQHSATKPVPSLGCHSSVSRAASHIFDKALSQEQVQQKIREEMGPAHNRDLVSLAQAYTSFEKSVQEVRDSHLSLVAHSPSPCLCQALHSVGALLQLHVLSNGLPGGHVAVWTDRSVSERRRWSGVNLQR